MHWFQSLAQFFSCSGAIHLCCGEISTDSTGFSLPERRGGTYIVARISGKLADRGGGTCNVPNDEDSLLGDFTMSHASHTARRLCRMSTVDSY